MLRRYFDTLRDALDRSAATDGTGAALPVETAVRRAVQICRQAHADGRKTMFIGNGGSAGIASHMAIDFTKNGGMRALALNDGAALTCLGNDFGYEHVFAKQIEYHGVAGDALIAISSSGRSPNILAAVAAARAAGCRVATLSGFDADNPLRGAGELNFYVPSHEYGFVEVGHLALIHAMVDFACGWDERAAAAAGAVDRGATP